MLNKIVLPEWLDMETGAKLCSYAAYEAFHAEQRARRELPVAEQDFKLGELLSGLARMDWYYDYTDDGSVWRTANRHYEWLRDWAKRSAEFRQYFGPAAAAKSFVVTPEIQAIIERDAVSLPEPVSLTQLERAVYDGVITNREVYIAVADAVECLQDIRQGLGQDWAWRNLSRADVKTLRENGWVVTSPNSWVLYGGWDNSLKIRTLAVGAELEASVIKYRTALKKIFSKVGPANGLLVINKTCGDIDTIMDLGVGDLDYVAEITFGYITYV